MIEVDVHGDLFAEDYACRTTEYGIVFWGNETGKLKIIKQEKDVAIIRESGHQYFSGRGNFPYTSPRYYVGIINFGKTRGTKGEVDRFSAIYSFEYKKNQQKEARELALELFNNIKECCVA